VTSDGWHVLRRTTFDHQNSKSGWSTQHRETYDRGKTIMLLQWAALTGPFRS
jgi:hypothetical protein